MIINISKLPRLLIIIYAFLMPNDFFFTIYFGMSYSPSMILGLSMFFLISYVNVRNFSIGPTYYFFMPYILYLLVHPGNYIGVGVGEVIGIITSLMISLAVFNIIIKDNDGVQLVWNILFSFYVGVALNSSVLYFGWFGLGSELYGRIGFEGYDVNNMASVNAIAIIIGMVFLSRSSMLITIFVALTLIPIIISFSSTGSRGGLASFVIILFALAYLYIFKSKELLSKKLIFSVFGIIISGTLLYSILESEFFIERINMALYEKDSSGRGDIWSAALSLLSEKPLLGYGVGEMYINIADKVFSSTNAMGTHNTFIYILVSGGLLFGSLAIVSLVFPIFIFVSKWRTNVKSQHLVVLFLVFIQCILISMSIDWLTRKYIWLFMGCLLGALALAQRISVCEK